MILTGRRILDAVAEGDITIDPFVPEHVNPNSYNYRLGDRIVVLGESQSVDEFDIPAEGYVVRPGRLYLATTVEVLGSSKYAMSLIGRSSIGRLGLFVQVSANLGHVGSKHRWTLELVPSRAIRLHAGMVIGQISFWNVHGDYSGGGGSAVYSSLNCPERSTRQGWLL